MSPDMAWPLTIFGGAVVWVAITMVADWVRKRRSRQGPTWWERDMRYRQQDREIRESEPHGWSH